MKDFHAINRNSSNYERWQHILKNFCYGLREFSGDIFERGESSSRYVNMLGYRNGHAYAFEHDGKIYITHAGIKKFNYMYQPSEIININPYIAGGEPIRRTIHKDAVYLPLTPDGKTLRTIVSQYASRLSRFEDDMYMNSIFTRSQKIFSVADDPTANKVRALFDDLIDGKIGVIVDDNFGAQVMRSITAGGGILSLSSDTDFLGYEYATMIRETLREFAEVIGVQIGGGNVMKKERNTAGEVASNSSYINVYANAFNNDLNNAIDEMNKIFGTNVSYTWIGGEKNESLSESTNMGNNLSEPNVGE